MSIYIYLLNYTMMRGYDKNIKIDIVKIIKIQTQFCMLKKQIKTFDALFTKLMEKLNKMISK